MSGVLCAPSILPTYKLLHHPPNSTKQNHSNCQYVLYRMLTDEEEILREVLKSLGQFEGLDSLTWLELLRKKLDIESSPNETPIISFGVNDVQREEVELETVPPSP